MLQIYNSLNRQKQIFTPRVPGEVRLYVCGMTVYDYCHVGHARVLVVFDVVVRWLRAQAYRVTYVRNITDIDDKIIARARENGESIEQLTTRFIEAMHADSRALGIVSPDLEPRATESIADIVAMVEKLVRNGHAYVAANGDVYYDVDRFERYGALSGERPEALRAGARVEIDEAKDDPLDFVLWKAAKPGEPAWDSPWGRGRPGWHIECSAMSTRCLGPHFDIHGGGMDLKFPHHENEIAQSEAATEQPFVNVWMHNGFVRVNDEKMSKSLGNFFTVREVLARYHPEEVRYFILSSHYRSPLNYSQENLDLARAALTRLYTAVRGAPVETSPTPNADDYQRRFESAMNDDFNTPEALAVLFDLAGACNRAREAAPERAHGFIAALRRLAGTLGLLKEDAGSYLRREHAGAEAGDFSVREIEDLIAARIAARRRRDWPEADRIRAALIDRGVVLEDGASGTVWRRT